MVGSCFMSFGANGQSRKQTRARSRTGVYLEFTGENLHTLPNIGEPKTGCGRVPVKSPAIVAELEVEFGATALDAQPGFGGAGVADHVIQSFLHDAVDIDLLIHREQSVDIIQIEFDSQ